MTVYDYVKVLAKERNVDIKSVEMACEFGNGTISTRSPLPIILPLYSKKRTAYLKAVRCRI